MRFTKAERLEFVKSFNKKVGLLAQMSAIEALDGFKSIKIVAERNEFTSEGTEDCPDVYEINIEEHLQDPFIMRILVMFADARDKLKAYEEKNRALEKWLSEGKDEINSSYIE